MRVFTTAKVRRRKWRSLAFYQEPFLTKVKGPATGEAIFFVTGTGADIVVSSIGRCHFYLPAVSLLLHALQGTLIKLRTKG